MFLPTQDYKQITSYFGFRIHPTTFKESYHSGIDISVPEVTNITSICNGTVDFVGFYGAYGYSIIIENNNYQILYAHVSPNFIVNSGTTVFQNQIIGNVRPKYIQDFSNNKYYDSNRKSNKWAYYSSSFTFNNKKRRHCRQSFRLFLITYPLHILPNPILLNYHILDILFQFYPNQIQ